MATRRTSNVASMEGTRVSSKNVTIPFNDLYEQGAYYSHATGWLYRVPEESLSPGHSPTMNIMSGDEHYVTKISDDPWIPVNKAREIASNKDFVVNF